jgi:hypothetical protein
VDVGQVAGSKSLAGLAMDRCMFESVYIVLQHRNLPLALNNTLKNTHFH